MNPNAASASGEALVSTSTTTQQQRKRRNPDNQFLFSWKLSADNVIEGCESRAPRKDKERSSKQSEGSEDLNKKRNKVKRERPEEDEEGEEKEGNEDAKRDHHSNDLNLEEIVEEARQLAISMEELRQKTYQEQEEQEEDKFMPLSVMFELHPLGMGLGDKLQKLKGEGLVLEPEHLMCRLTPNLDKYEQLISERREKEKRREMLLAQLVKLHDQSKRLREERLRGESSSPDSSPPQQEGGDDLPSSEQSLVPTKQTLIARKDAHLLHWTTTRLMLEEYQQNAWAFSPLHPSAINEDNVRIVLYGERHWEREASALSLNVHTALALGSLITGNEDKAMHFFRLARNEVGNMFDSSDYNVAEALVGLRYFAYALGDVEQACYFMTMAMSICRQLGAYSSDVYTRCLADLYFLPSTSPLERKRWLSEYCKYASSPSTFDATRIYSVVYNSPEESGSDERNINESNTYHASLVKKSNYNNFSSIESVLQLFVRALIALDRSGAGMRGKELGEARQVMSDIQHTNSEMAARVLGTKASYPMRMAGGLGKPGGAKPPPAASHTTEAILSFLNAQFSVLETAILKDTLPASFTLTVLLCSASMRSEAYWGLGDTMKALECAKKYVSISSQTESRIRRISITHLPYCNKILHILLYLDELDLLELQLKLFRPLFELFPSWRETRDYYELKLKDRRAKLQMEQAQQSSMQVDEVKRLKHEIEQWHRVLAKADHQREDQNEFDRFSPSIIARTDSTPALGQPITDPTLGKFRPPYDGAVLSSRPLHSYPLQPSSLDPPFVPPYSRPYPSVPAPHSQPATSGTPLSTASRMPLATASAAASAASAAIEVAFHPSMSGNSTRSLLFAPSSTGLRDASAHAGAPFQHPETRPPPFQPSRQAALTHPAQPQPQLQLPPLPLYAHQIASSSSSFSSNGSPEAAPPQADPISGLVSPGLSDEGCLEGPYPLGSEIYLQRGAGNQ